jgi:ABC-type transporter Mla subunit MlaD
LIQTLRRFQTETQSLKEKISSKNDIIRQQEKMVQEQKERLNDLNRKNLSLEETIGLLNQKRALLEREFNESKKQIQESVKVIQDNEKVHVPSLLSILSSPDSLSLRSSLISTRCSQTFNWEVLGLGGACLLLALADTPPPCIAPPGAGEGMEPLW